MQRKEICNWRLEAFRRRRAAIVGRPSHFEGASAKLVITSMAEQSVEGRVQAEGAAHIYGVEFPLPENMLEIAVSKYRNTTRIICAVKGEYLEMKYTVWCHSRTGWNQELCLVGAESSHMSISSFKTRLATSAPRPAPYKSELLWKQGQTIFKTDVEAVDRKLKRLSVTVKVKLLYMLPEGLLEPKEDLAGKLLARLEESADVELQGQGFNVKAHSSILGMRSEVLQAFFAKRWDRKRPFVFDLNKAVPETLPETVVRSVVQYCYTLKVPKIEDSPHKRAFLSLADELGLESLFRDWSEDFKLGGLDDVRDVMTWPGLDSELPYVSALKKKVEEQAVQLGKEELEKHGLDLAKELLLAVKRQQEEETGGDEGTNEMPEDGSTQANGLGVRIEDGVFSADVIAPRKKARRASIRDLLEG